MAAKPVKRRVYEHYWRHRHGRALWKVEAPENLIIEALIGAGHLRSQDALDKGAVEFAIGVVLEEWARNNSPKS